MAEDAAIVREVAAQVAAYLRFERAMATPGVPAPQPASPVSVSASTPVPASASITPQRSETSPQPPTPEAADPGVQTATSETAPRAAGDVARLPVLAAQAEACTACGLHEERNRSVFARGNPTSDVVFVGEGPGRDEDAQGEPFVGAAGKLLDRMVAAMGYQRDDVYICNVVKCRPPNNRTPRPEEASACAPFLREQLAIVNPKVIVALGKCAAEHLGVAPPEGTWRGRWGRYEGVTVMPTYHPAFLLRSPEFKRVVWQDLQRVMEALGRPVPTGKR